MVLSGIMTDPGEPSTMSSAEEAESASCPVEDPANDVPVKKRKKRRPKKKADTSKANIEAQVVEHIPKSPVLCISRNKHWRYISSYHGPWLQLPVELLESLLSLNLDPGTFASNDSRPRPSQSTPTVGKGKTVNRATSDSTNPSEHETTNALPFPCQCDISHLKPNTPIPPPIDPGVFRSVTSIRRYIDEASDLAVRAASGLSAAALGAVLGSGTSPSYNNSSPWATAQSLGINPFSESIGNGRNVSMSANRIHRLRVLAVSRLAAAYRADEIAASVMVMQGASALDDIANRVLKIEPHNIDARYVHFFHEKIPSRQLAECTTTAVLDDLIRSQPHVLEYYRTRGIVHCFRDEYQLAIRDFTYALKEGRTLRKSRHVHATGGLNGVALARRPGKSHKGKKKLSVKTNGQAPPAGTAAPEEGHEGAMLPVHPSLLEDAPTALEHQLLFLRGAAYLQSAIHQIEQIVLELEGVSKGSAPDGAEIRLCYLDNGQYGGVEIGNPDGPLGHLQGRKVAKYRSVLGATENREKIMGYLKKSIRDHEKFLSHFDTFSHACPSVDESGCRTEAEGAELAYLISESARSQQGSTPRHTDVPFTSFTTYHPLLVESHFSILLCVMLLGQFETLLSSFSRAAMLVDTLEGYPVFLPARSMAQAEFVEVLERLASGWRLGGLSGGEPEGEMGDRLRAVRTILGPVLKRQRERAEQALNGEKRKGPINIPLHGPRVEIILAWLGATHLPELAEAADLGD